MITLIHWITKNVKNSYNRFCRVISSSFAGLLNRHVVPYDRSQPFTMNVDELNKIFIINHNGIIAHGRCSNLVFKTRPYFIIPDMYKANIADFNALISPCMVDLIHAAAMIKICYHHQPIIYASIAHELLDMSHVIYGSDMDARLKIDHFNLARLIEQYPINTSGLLNHLQCWMNKPQRNALINYVFKIQIVLEYDLTMVESYASFHVDLFDKTKMQDQLERALNDSYHKYNTHVGNLNAIIVNIITPLNIQ